MDCKIKAIKNFPTPTDTEKVLSLFLGLSGYNRAFVRNYASTASSLTHLLKKNIVFTWNGSQQQSFDTLKHELTLAPVLIS